MQKKPQNVYMPTDEFLAEVMERPEGEERSKWVSQFALHLAKGRGNNEFAEKLLNEAVKGIERNRIAQLRYKAKQSLIEEGIKKPSKEQVEARMREYEHNESGYDQVPTLDAENGNASDDRKAPPSSEPFADADIREDSENIATPQGALLESGTSAETFQGSARPSCGSAAKNRRRLPPPTAESVYEFANQASLDTADAREWYEINFVDRPGCDKDGIVIENWKGHCKNFCKAAANKRKQAG